MPLDSTWISPGSFEFVVDPGSIVKVMSISEVCFKFIRASPSKTSMCSVIKSILFGDACDVKLKVYSNWLELSSITRLVLGILYL